MSRYLLAAACAVVLAAPAAAQMKPERRTQLESRLPQWQDVKAQEKRAVDTFLATIEKSPNTYNVSGFRASVDEALKHCANIEATERARFIKLKTRMDEDVRNGKMSLEEWNRRSTALTRLAHIRVLYVWGNLLPRILDEAPSNAGVKGRTLAGPDWEIVLTEDEMKELHADYKRECGFAAAELDGAD